MDDYEMDLLTEIVVLALSLGLLITFGYRYCPRYSLSGIKVSLIMGLSALFCFALQFFLTPIFGIPLFEDNQFPIIFSIVFGAVTSGLLLALSICAGSTAIGGRVRRFLEKAKRIK